MARKAVPAIQVSVGGGDWGPARGLRALARRVVAAAVEAAGVELAPGSELSILFADDAAMRALNARWRGKDKPTNVLSFPGREIRAGEVAGPMLGDIVLARQTIMREAREQAKPVLDHLAHLIAHGFLHLCGHDHLNETGARAMESAECRALAALGIADPYAERPRRRISGNRPTTRQSTRP